MSWEMKGPMEMLLLSENQFYKHKNEINIAATLEN